MAQLPQTTQPTMKAVVYTAYGEPKDVIKIVDLPIPKPGPNEVLIKVYAVSLNAIDYKLVQGWFAQLLKKPFPTTVGIDFAGVIEEIGHKVRGNLQKGLRVAGQIPFTARTGTWSQYLTISPAFIVPIPDNCSFVESAALPLVGSTSYQGLVEKGHLRKGNKVLILGGNTATGLIAIQLAKIFEASRIVATCSSGEDELKKLGCTELINHKTEQWYDKLKGENFDIIYDSIGGIKSWEKSLLVLKRSGYYVTIVGDAEHGANGGLKGFLSAGLTSTGRKWKSLFNQNSHYELLSVTPMFGLKN